MFGVYSYSAVNRMAMTSVMHCIRSDLDYSMWIGVFTRLWAVGFGEFEAGRRLKRVALCGSVLVWLLTYALGQQICVNPGKSLEASMAISFVS